MVTSSSRIRVAAVALAGLLMLSACADDAPSTLGPAATFKAFFNACWLHAQDQFQSDRVRAYDLLDQASQRALEERAEALQASSNVPLGIEPHELLMVSSLPLGTPIERIEVVEESEVAATLQIKFGEGEAQATMVREEGVWRVSLLRTPEGR